MLTSAADGDIRYHDLNNPAGERLLLSVRGMANMFDFQSPNVVFATNFRRGIISLGGSVELIDIRDSQNQVTMLDSSRDQIKALAVYPHDTNYFAVGVGSELWMCDTRLRSDDAERGGNSSCVVEKLTFDGVHEMEQRCDETMGYFLPCFHPVDADGRTLLQTKMALRTRQTRYEETTISSIEFSKVSNEVLLSFQGDIIYRYGMGPSSELGGSNWFSRIPTQMFAGHLNEETFLKRASYFGPDDEYIVCGGDDGNVFVYASSTGELVSCKRGDGSNNSRGIVNGVAPHPFANCFVSYGLDPTAKLWVVTQGDNEEGEADQQPSVAVWESIEKAAKKAASSVSAGQYAAEAPVMMMIRCTRQIENARRHKKDASEVLPSTSLVLEAMDQKCLSLPQTDWKHCASEVMSCFTRRIIKMHWNCTQREFTTA